ncbi:ORF6C domain-containing protein [Anaerocolumna aminovalerica]|uniref:ORF6N domain-containing protein n=1 Tax=Anaerocolumna aminovalerica TaxID=1527 RepID=UPI001C0E952C|nr:ORF6N domain-containing protein [Anaerocolumna aminovalerica]MBU5333595.1 ORF6C domain-containing protein [Anaerocolumna aminovalerica]
MNEILNISGVTLNIKMYNGERVVTFKDIDMVHKKSEGSARKRFHDNNKHFIENEDFYIVKPKDFQKSEKRTSGIESEDINNRGTILMTESGYLMIAKSFTDDLAWKVQRNLVNSYFKLKEVAKAINENSPVGIESINKTIDMLQRNFGIVCQQVNSMENVLDTQNELLNKVMDNMTLTTRQQEKLLEAARNRVNNLLGGAHSELYKKMARTYMVNLWNNVKSNFHCGSSYKDLNPSYFDNAIDYINQWNYIE